MKKLLAIIVLGLVFSGNAFAEWVYITNGSINDNGINIKLDKYFENASNKKKGTIPPNDEIIRHNICNVELQPNICDF